MFKSMKKNLVFGAVFALGAVHCNLVPLNGSPLGGSSSVTSSSTTDIQIGLLPESSWTPNGGTINPVCTGGANPRETGFTSVGGGVSISTGSDRVDCCTCAARTRTLAVAKTSVAGTRLRGTLLLSRGQADAYSVASMRVTLESSGSVVASRIVAAEHRSNDNCAGSSELPEVLVDPSGQFDLDLAAIAPNATFDAIKIDLMGYACGTATNSATLEETHLVTSSSAPLPTQPPSPSPAPSSPSAPPGPPDLATSLTPSQWGSYASGTIGRTNNGIAGITNHGTGVAHGVTLDLHSETTNPAGAPLETADTRCVQAFRDAVQCSFGDLAPGASIAVNFTFNSFADTTVVAIAKSTNADADFSDNRVVGHVYPSP